MINLSEKDADFIASIIRSDLSELNEAIEMCEKESRKIKDYKLPADKKEPVPGLLDILKTEYLENNSKHLAGWNRKRQDFTRCLELLITGSD